MLDVFDFDALRTAIAASRKEMVEHCLKVTILEAFKM